MRYIVDHIEGDKAVLECRVNKRKKVVELNLLPENIHDGDILMYRRREYILLTKETIEKTEYMKNRFNNLKK